MDALHGLNFEAEITPPTDLRTRWQLHSQALNPNRPAMRRLFAARAVWVAALILALAMLVIFRQPVMAAVGRLFGYVYVQDSGFLPADSTFVLEQPLVQVHDGQTLTVTHGVSTPDGTTLFIEFSATASPAEGASLETGSGLQLALSAWEYFPNTPGSHGVRLTFPALPNGLTRTSLVLPAGWHLPLTWIPAARSQLPDVRAVPYIDATQQPGPAADLCAEKNGIRLCLQAATSGSDNTSLLLEAQATDPALIPGSDFGLVTRSQTEPVTLRDEQGTVYPMDYQRRTPSGTLNFPSLSGTHTLTLTVPAVFASVDIPDQTIRVDMGADPQPDTVIALDANIQVLGATLHFSKATFVGLGDSSLRLILNADEPVQTVAGITPFELELGRPDRVDDLYGGGDLGGSQDIHVELIHGGKKITGVLNLPIVRATVMVKGPFEFTFKLSDLPATTATPLVVDPGAFAPAPTPTPLSLDSYSYSGETLQTGDLLYALWNGNQSDLYHINPAGGNAPTLFMTLPGSVSALYLYPDRQGLDYLAGKYNPDTGMENVQLYTLRFSDSRPHVLHTSPAGSLSGPTWSADGRLLAFNFQLPDPGEFQSHIGWIDMNCRSSGECPVQLLEAPLEDRLGGPVFSPQGYWLAINGADTTYGAGEIYLLPFDNNAQAGELQNFTHSDHPDDQSAGWIAGNKLVWMCPKDNPNDPVNGIPNICLQDIASAASVPQIIFTFNDSFWFGLSSQGNYFWQMVINRNVQREEQIWLNDRKGARTKLSAAPSFDLDSGKPAFSLDERYLAYISADNYDKADVPQSLHIAATSTGAELAHFENTIPVGWLGWVP